MSEVAATRKYRLNVKSASQSQEIVNEIIRMLKEILSPNVCEFQAEAANEDPSNVSITMRCVDGKTVHQADVRSMFKILQMCEKDNIIHEIGDLEVLFD